MLHEVGAPFEDVYFIEEGVASVLTNMADGSTIEVGMIGMEGMVGVTALLGGNVSAQQVIVQVPGTALRMSAALCRAAFDRSEGVRSVALRFIEAILNLSAQTAACNRLHSIEQRCARWLLMAIDRVLYGDGRDREHRAHTKPDHTGRKDRPDQRHDAGLSLLE